MQARSASLRQRARLAGGLREGRALRKNLLQATLVHCPLVLFIDLPLESIWSRIGHFYISADNSGGSRPWAKGGTPVFLSDLICISIALLAFLPSAFFHYFNFFCFCQNKGGSGFPGPFPQIRHWTTMPVGRISVPGVVFCLISRGILKKAPPTAETTNTYQRISAWERDVLLCCIVNTRSSCWFFCFEIPRIFRNFNNFSLLILRTLLGTWPECY